MKLLGQQEEEAAPTGTHIPTWQHLQWGAQAGYPMPGAATLTGIQDRDAP